MKRVLFIASNPYVAWGGSEILWFKTAQLFVKKGLQVGVAINKWDTMPEALINFKNEHNIDFIYKQIKNSTATKIYNKIAPKPLRKSHLNSWKKNILGWKPDFVVVSQACNFDGADIMCFLAEYNIKYISISQSVIDFEWPGPSQLIANETAFGAAQCNYFVSKANLKLTEYQLAGGIKNAKVINNPFNVPFDNNLKYPQHDFFSLASVGRYDYYSKGQDLLLQLMNDQKWKNRNLKLNFYGNGRHKDHMLKFVSYYGLKNTIVNDHLNTINIWEQNQALVMPSRFEGLPLSLVEAMLCNRFGIVTDVSGNAEVIEDNVNGFVAGAAKAEYIDEAMERAWQRRAEWEEIGKKARNYIVQLVPEDPIEAFYNEISQYLN